jgi:hypothetical protein
LHLSGYRFRFRREVVGYRPDPRFRPFFWKDNDDDSHGFEDERLDDSATDVAPGTTNMEVDGHPPAQSFGAAAAPVTQVALTPFNHSSMTDRGREIVPRARTMSPHLVASPPATSRASSPSRVRTFMQGRTRLVSSDSSLSTPPRTPQVAPTQSSTSAQTELTQGLQAQPEVTPSAPPTFTEVQRSGQ